LGPRPLSRSDRASVGALVVERAAVAGLPGAPALGVGAAAVEGAVLLPAVALGGHHDTGTVGDGALEQDDVGLLAGLQHPELGVDRSAVGDDPVGGGRG